MQKFLALRNLSTKYAQPWNANPVKAIANLEDDMNIRANPVDHFFGILGILTFIAAILTFGLFVISLTILSFWTFEWFIHIIFICLFASVAVGFMMLSGNDLGAILMIAIIGIGFSCASFALYLYFGYKHCIGDISGGEFSGFMTLFTFFCAIGIYGVAHAGNGKLRYLSYGYVTMDLCYLFILYFKYVLKPASFVFQQFVGEVFILAYGVILFLTVFLLSKRRIKLLVPRRNTARKASRITHPKYHREQG